VLERPLLSSAVSSASHAGAGSRVGDGETGRRDGDGDGDSLDMDLDLDFALALDFVVVVVVVAVRFFGFFFFGAVALAPPSALDAELDSPSERRRDIAFAFETSRAIIVSVSEIVASSREDDDDSSATDDAISARAAGVSARGCPLRAPRPRARLPNAAAVPSSPPRTLPDATRDAS
jgi:hypothetical protein